MPPYCPAPSTASTRFWSRWRWTSRRDSLQMAVVGLPGRQLVKESKDRVRWVLKNSCDQFPQRKITINLAPADIKKEGPAYDLPIALGLLAATASCRPRTARVLIVGELSLDGGVRRSGGAAAAAAARRRGRADLVPGTTPRRRPWCRIEVYRWRRWRRRWTPRRQRLKPASSTLGCSPSAQYDVDFSEVKGQEHVKRALEVAAAGGHNMLMVGPPGAGKTMLAQRLPRILPPLTLDEALETTRVHSVMGRWTGAPWWPRGRFARRTTRSATRAWSAAARSRSRARSASRTTACCSSTSCRSFATCSKSCGSRWRRAHHHLARRRSITFPPLHAGRGDEPVPVRLLRRPAEGLHAARRCRSSATSPASPGRCWTASTSTSRCRRCATRSCGPERGRAVRRDPRPRPARPRRAAGALRRPHDPLQRADERPGSEALLHARRRRREAARAAMTRSASAPAPTPASSRCRAPSPTWTACRRSPRRTWPRRSSTAAWTAHSIDRAGAGQNEATGFESGLHQGGRTRTGDASSVRGANPCTARAFVKSLN